MAGKPDILKAMEAAVADHRRGRLEAAIAGYKAVLRLHDAFPEAHNNLGLALRAAGHLDRAATSYRRALQLRPAYAAAHGNLAVTLAELGDKTSGLRHALEAWKREPGNLRFRRVLAAGLRGMTFSEASPVVVEAVEACLEDPEVDRQWLVPAARSLLVLRPPVRDALNARSLSAAFRAGQLDGLLEDRLLQKVMTNSVLADESFERLLTGLRCLCLELLSDDQGVGPGVLNSDPNFAAALACQCALTDYAYAETATEQQQVSRLMASAEAGGLDTPALIVLAMYRRLDAFPGAVQSMEQARSRSPSLERLYGRQVSEPLAERDIEADLPGITPLEDSVSRKVRSQYEENPYPRWLSTGGKDAVPLDQLLRGLFPHIQIGDRAARPTRALVAGCGTGKHAVDVARRYKDVQVLAVDLSRASLAYGRRKAEEAGLSNIRFAQGDILALDALPDRFDLIEALGVLHHLADPVAGWRSLAGLLAEGGVMKIGLYSRRGRQAILAARDLLRAEGFTPDPTGIRAARQAIFALAPDRPERRVAGELDFYSLSGCRDLLFHAQEREYDLPEIAAMLDDLGLELLGFEFADDEARRAYAEQYPQDPAGTDLALWDTFESEHPDTFRNMYQFWCRKA